MKKSEKSIFVDNLTEELKSAKSTVLINYSGLSVKKQQDLKKRLKGVGAKMLVVKNTLLRRAGEAAKVDPQILVDSVLQGQTALIVATNDPIAPLQVLGNFLKEFDSGAGYSVPKFKVGVVEGSFQDATDLAKLSTLPGRDVLFSQVLGALMSPSYELVSTLNGNLQKLVYILNQKSEARSTKRVTDSRIVETNSNV